MCSSDLLYVVEEACKVKKISLRGATVAIQGYGNVGSAVCQELHQKGVKITGVGDRYGSITNPQGIDLADLNQYLASGKRLPDYPGAEVIPNDELLTLPCTILIPAAVERVITGKNAAKLKCRVLAEAANGPTTPEADEKLAGSDIFIIPDILCNAGGVTVSYFEWVQDIQQFFWEEDEVNKKLELLMLRSFRKVLKRARDRKLSMRMAALSLGIEKVAKEKLRRGLFP